MTCLVGLTSSAVHRESFDASRVQLANQLIKSSGFPETCGYGSHITSVWPYEGHG